MLNKTALLILLGLGWWCAWNRVSAETWVIETWSNGNGVTGLTATAGALWASTTGGLVDWNPVDGSYTKLTTADGLSDSWFTSCTTDTAGVLWFGSLAGGLWWYDGQAWGNLGTADGLPYDHITALAADVDNRLWAGFGAALGNGLGIKNGDNWTFLTTAVGLNHNFVTAIAATEDGAWVGSKLGLNRIEGYFVTGGWTTVDGLAGDYVSALAARPDGSVWIATSDGISHFDGASFINYTTENGLPSDNVQALLVVDTAIYAGTDNGLAVLDGTEWRQVAANQLRGTDIRALAALPGESIACGVYNRGIDLLVDRQVTDSLVTDDWLPDNEVRGLGFDGDRLWFGTAAGGVGWYDGENHAVFAPEDGIGSAYVRCLAVDAGGVKWFGTYGAGVYSYDNETWHHLGLAEGLPDERVMGAYVDGDAVWFATWGGGVCRYQAGEWFIIDSGEGLPNDRTYDIERDSDGGYWICTDVCVSYYLDGEITSYYEEDGLVFHRVYAVDIGPDGVIWFGACKGMSRFDGAAFTNYYTTDGLAHYRVRDMEFDGNGLMWLATGGGANTFDGETFTSFLPSDHFAGYETFDVLPGPVGGAWFCSKGGITRISQPAENRPPQILAAGCRHCALPSPFGSLVWEAIPLDPDGDAITLELAYDGIGLGWFLNDLGRDGDTTPGDGIFSLVLPLPAQAPGISVMTQLAAADTGGLRAWWPELCIE
ncbi:hypothetical protein JW905_10715 [bacterium]|nr:hypothetical protein [candidate division CSSED10-310 bacterium]